MGPDSAWCSFGLYQDAAGTMPVAEVGQRVARLDPLLAVIDRQLEIERKARAWDLAVLAFGDYGRAILAGCLVKASERPPARAVRTRVRGR